jgi:hypothetical protein
LVFKDPSGLQVFFYFLSGLEEFMKEKPWRHLATSQQSSHHVWLIIFIGTMIFPSSTKFCWQDAWMDEDIENFYGFCIIASILKCEFIREGQVIIVQIREPKGIGETSEKEFKELTDVLVNGYS